MATHSLTQIDLVTRKAVCSVCGPTEIHVTRPRTTNPPRVYCAQGLRESWIRAQARRPRRFAPGLPRHILTEIDEGNCTAVCAICGPTDVYRARSRGNEHYRCATHLRALVRRNSGAHVVNPYARVHILSEIDQENGTAVCAKCGRVSIEQGSGPAPGAGHPGVLPESGAPKYKYVRQREKSWIVFDYKRRHICKRCGAMGVLETERFGFFEMHLPREQWISALIETAAPEELAAELEKRDLYCNQCLRLVNSSFANNMPVPEFRPLPTLF